MNITYTCHELVVTEGALSLESPPHAVKICRPLAGSRHRAVTSLHADAEESVSAAAVSWKVRVMC